MTAITSDMTEYLLETGAWDPLERINQHDLDHSKRNEGAEHAPERQHEGTKTGQKKQIPGTTPHQPERQIPTETRQHRPSHKINQ